MSTDRLVVVTATTNTARALECLRSWGHVQIVIVAQREGRPPVTLHDTGTICLTYDQYLGVVPAFRLGVDFALEHSNADIIACLHDDLELHDATWAEQVVRHFDRQPACGLLGFGGAIGLGSDDLYT
jgi:hypothetical protein